MDSREVLDRIARLGLFGKRYKDFESAPPEAQKVIRLLADSSPTLPPTEAETEPLSRSDRGDRAFRTEARLKKIETSIARIERGLAKLADGIERFEQLDVIKSATRLHVDRAMKIRAGIVRAQRQGKLLGRPRREFSRDELLKLRGEGLSIREIASRTGISRTTVCNALKADECTEIGRERWLN